MTSLPLFAFITHIITFFSLLSTQSGSLYKNVILCAGAFFSVMVVSLLSLDDYENYASVFRSIDIDRQFFEQSIILYGENLYLFINYVFRFFTDDFNLVRCFLLFFAMILKIVFLVRWGRYYALSLTFYISMLFYPDSYLLRSTVASSILLLSIWALYCDKRWYYFFIPVFIAAGFHSSAIVALPLWFLAKIQLSKSIAILIIIISVALGIIGIGHIAVQLFLDIFSTDVYVIDKLFMYSESKYGSRMSLLKGSLVIYLLIAFIFIMSMDTIKKIMPHYNLTLVLILYSLFILLAFSDFLVLSERLFRLFTISFSIALGFVFSVIKEKDRTILAMITLILLNILPYYTDVGPYRLIY